VKKSDFSAGAGPFDRIGMKMTGDLKESILGQAQLQNPMWAVPCS
jgi:hypothetical protein